MAAPRRKKAAPVNRKTTAPVRGKAVKKPGKIPGNSGLQKKPAAKSAAAGKKAQQEKNRAEKSNGFPLMKEIVVIITLAVCILIFISCFGNDTSALKWMKQGMFFLFGNISYLIPFVLFFTICFMISNEGDHRVYVKLAGGGLCLIAACGISQLIFHGGAGGGVIGIFLIGWIEPYLGALGSYVIMLCVMAIGIVILTERSIIGLIKRHSKRAYGKVKDKAAVHREKKAVQAGKKAVIQEQKLKELEQRKREAANIRLDVVSEPEIKPILKDSEEKEINQPILHGFVGDITYSDNHEKKENEGQPQESEKGDIEKEEPMTRTVVTAAGKVIKAQLDQVAGARPVEKPEPKEAQVEPIAYTEPKEYEFPPISLLKRGRKGGLSQKSKEQELRNTALKLQQTLQNFGVGVTVTNISCGPAVTRYELHPEQGVKVSKIVSLTDDIKLNLAAADIRIEAPIPGKAAIGIEVPNKENQAVLLRDLLESQEFLSYPSKIAFAVGKNIAGSPVVADIARMPHLLIAGATGSGKSVCINTLIMSILYKAKPSEVKLIMIDPKVVELSVYNGIPHLMIPVVTDPKKAAGALNWAVAEMTDRYQKFAEYNVRDRQGYNEKIESMPAIDGKEKPNKLPQIVIIVDELADLMMVAPGDVEDAICRLAQMARAAGIHLVIATQRPSVNVVTGLIKANVPSRIAFSVSSGVDSRTIIDMNGAEKLLGKGDMLFYPSGYQKPDRVQGALVSDMEVAAVVGFLSKQINVEGGEQNQALDMSIEGKTANAAPAMADKDEYFAQAGEFVIEKERASIGMLQRMFKIGFNRAARIVDQLAQTGVVGEEEGTKPRKILMTMEEFHTFIRQNGE